MRVLRIHRVKQTLHWIASRERLLHLLDEGKRRLVPMIGRTSGRTHARRRREARNRRRSVSTIVFAVLAVFFAVLSATTAQRVKQLAEVLEKSRKRLREAVTRTAVKGEAKRPISAEMS
jgi:hypothetical protein